MLGAAVDKLVKIRQVNTVARLDSCVCGDEIDLRIVGTEKDWREHQEVTRLKIEVVCCHHRRLKTRR
jgi:hypothetical protein